VDRETTTFTHEFVPPLDGRPAKIVDTYSLESAAAVFTPANFEGVELRVHFNGDILSVEPSTAILVKVSFASVLSDTAQEAKSTFPTVTHIWESLTGEAPEVPKGDTRHFLGGYSDEGGTLSFLFRLTRSPGAFAFGGLRLAFTQKMNRPETMYRFVDGVLELTRFADITSDPGPLSNKVFGKIWKHRNEVIKEIVSSEISYLSGIHCIIDVSDLPPFPFPCLARFFCLTQAIFIQMYKRPLEGSAGSLKPIVTKEEVETLFSNVELILNVNQELLTQLQQKMATWTDTTIIGDVFLATAPYLKSYTQYCNNYPKAMAMYNKKKTTHPRFTKFVETMRPRTENLELSSYFLLPVQRIPRYKMLLQDVVKHTWETHPDFENLVKALKLVTDITEYINTGIAKADNVGKMLEIQQRFESRYDLIQPTRWLIMEGEIVKMSDGQANTRTFFLFTDAIIYVQIKRKKYIFKGKWELASSWVKDIPDSPSTLFFILFFILFILFYLFYFILCILFFIFYFILFYFFN